MTGILQGIFNGFWSEYIWLPPNTTWSDITPGPHTEIQYTNSKHLYIPIPLAVIMLLSRYVLERYWFGPIGISLGIKSYRSKNAPTNIVLEKSYSSSKKMNHKQIQGLAKQLDWTERKVERWLRMRRSQDKPSTLVKFCENSWRCLYYFSSFVYGITILWDKSWFWDINECWHTYPNQSIDLGIWCYYMMSLTFYWSLCFSQFFDVKRKDFWQMFIHHIATILLMSLSWISNLVRIGSLVLVIHDCADIFLEAAKMAKYAGYQKVCDFIFAIFTVLWIITRMGVFPIWIIYNTSIVAPTIVPMFPAYYIFNGLLILLLVLHGFWTYLILKIVANSLNAGQMEGDIRSSTSCYSEDNNESIS